MEVNFIKVVFLLVLVTHLSEKTAAKISAADKTKIEKGLEAGKAIADVLKDGQFRKSLVSLGKNLAPFLGAIGPLTGLVLALLPSGDSEELAYMKKQFKEVNNKLDIITKEFAEVKNAIDWSTVQVSYGAYERKIRAAEANLNKVYTAANRQLSQHYMQYFLKNYESDFDNSLQKLYDAIMKNDHVFSKNIMEAVVKKTKNHKRKVEKFSLRLVQLLVQGITVKVAYLDMKKLPWYKKDLQEWTRKMNALSSELRRISYDVKRAYHKQLKSDVEDLIRRHHGLGNRGLVQTIYNFVVDKYDWRYWFVAVYKGIYGFDKHTILLCGGYSLFRRQGKNVIVASQDKVFSSRFKQRDAANKLQSVQNDINRCRMRDPGDRARALVNNVVRKVGNSCVPYALRMAVSVGKGLWFISSSSHRAYRKIHRRKRCCWGSIWWRKCKTVYWNHYVILFG